MNITKKLIKSWFFKYIYAIKTIFTKIKNITLSKIYFDGEIVHHNRCTLQISRKN